MTTQWGTRTPDDPARRMSRRDAIRRAAVIGGSLAWAAPAIQRVGMPAAFAEVSPAPPPPPPPPQPESAFYGISFVAFTFRCAGTWYKAKWEDGNGWVQLSGNDNGTANCGDVGRWPEATPVTSGNQVDGRTIDATPQTMDGEVYAVTITLPGQCLFEDGAGVVKGGAGGLCAVAPDMDGGSTFTFYANPK